MFISESLSSFVLRLRDKSSKARELALELNELQVPHQEAGFDCHHTLAPWHTLPMHVSRPCGRTWKRSASFCVTLLTGQSSLKKWIWFDLHATNLTHWICQDGRGDFQAQEHGVHPGHQNAKGAQNRGCLKSVSHAAEFSFRSMIIQVADKSIYRCVHGILSVLGGSHRGHWDKRRHHQELENSHGAYSYTLDAQVTMIGNSHALH